MPSLRATLIPVTPFRQNCTLLWDEASARGAIIDPGGDVADIIAAIDRAGAVVETILLTHGHLDHAGGAAELAAALGERGTAPPIIGPDRRDDFLLADIEEQAKRFGATGLRNVTPERYLEEGEQVSIGGLPFDVLHCPGHTPGHIVFVQKETRFAQVGDVLFRGSVGRTDFPYGDGPGLKRVIIEKLLPLGDDIAFICGHGPGSTFGEERASNPFLRD